MRRRTFVQSVLSSSVAVTVTGCMEGDGETSEDDNPESDSDSGGDNGGDSGSDSGGEEGDGSRETTFQFGETYTRSDGVEITVGSPETVESFVANGVQQTPEEGNIFIETFITAENTSDEQQSLPARRNFNLIFQNRQHEEAPFAHLKDDAYEGNRVQPGIIGDGSIVYEVTAEASPSDVQIVWSDISDEQATWG